MTKSLPIGLAALAMAVVIAGCGGGASTPASSTPTAAAVAAPKLNLSAPAGVTITAPADAANKQLLTMAHETNFGSRSDPFSLTASEKSFDASQSAMQLASQYGNMGYMGPDAPAAKVPPTVQEQPYRRLSGVCIGNAVYAILDTGNGEPQIIYPGVQVKGTDWTVVSIDMDEAVLTRPGDVLPKTITVRLEEAPPGMGGGGGGGGAAGGPAGGPAGGRPGGLPGVPGGPGGPGARAGGGGLGVPGK